MPEINFHDAQQALGFIVPQQLRIQTEVYQTRYPSFDYASLMFVNTDGDMWDIGSVFFSGDIAGAASFLSAKGFDMPYAEVARSQFLQANHLAGIGYEWTLGELQRAAKLGRNLGNEKAMAASKVAEAFLWGVAVTGSAEKNITGLVNDANVPAVSAAAGAAADTEWSTKTPDEILEDVNTALMGVYTATGETHMADTVLLPSLRLQTIASTRLGDTNDTILAFLRENNVYTAETGRPLNIKATRALNTAGTGGSARMVTYDNSREVVQFHLPGPHEFLPPFQKSSMTWEVAGIMNVGGTEIRLPKAVRYTDEI